MSIFEINPKGVLAIVIGIAAIVVGLVNKQFYAAKSMYSAGEPGKPVPRWAGRTLFIVVGIIFIFGGISLLVQSNR